MQGKTRNICLGIEILTPLQCGSGREMFHKLDYVDKNDKVFVVDQPQSFNAVASGKQDLDVLLSGGSDLDDLVRLAGEYYGYELPMLSRLGKVPEKIREHLKDALFQPYVAGSAVKGAIRTALLAEYLRALPKTDYQKFLPAESKRPRKEWAAQNLLDHVLGKEPKQDIFRALHVKDAMFKMEHLLLVDIRWLNLTGRAGQEKAQWRSMGEKKNFPRWKEADGIYAEMLRPGCTASLQLQWDEFLLSDTSQWHATQRDILPGDFEPLKTRLNNHARHRLQQEIIFYHQYSVSVPELECKKLLNQINKDLEGIYLQLSWGSGWRAMTGDWMDKDVVAEMRKLYELRKPDLPDMPFPKTRRLAVSGEPKWPLGWVRLFPYVQNAPNPITPQAIEEIAPSPDVEHGNNLNSLEAELEDFLKSVSEQEWDTRLLQELEKGRWSGEEAKQVAEKIKQLMLNIGKWQPEFKGSNKQKLKYKERSLKVLQFLHDSKNNAIK